MFGNLSVEEEKRGWAAIRQRFAASFPEQGCWGLHVHYCTKLKIPTLENGWIQEVEKVVQYSSPKALENGQSCQEFCWRTLMVDQTENERPAPHEYARYYETYKWMLRRRLLASPGSDWSEARALLDPNYNPETDRNHIDADLPVIDDGLITHDG